MAVARIASTFIMHATFPLTTGRALRLQYMRRLY